MTFSVLRIPHNICLFIKLRDVIFKLTQKHLNTQNRIFFLRIAYIICEFNEYCLCFIAVEINSVPSNISLRHVFS